MPKMCLQSAIQDLQVSWYKVWMSESKVKMVFIAGMVDWNQQEYSEGTGKNFLRGPWNGVVF